jgi:hypothetical protein
MKKFQRQWGKYQERFWQGIERRIRLKTLYDMSRLADLFNITEELVKLNKARKQKRQIKHS